DRARRATEIARQLDDFPTRVTADIYAGRALHALGRYRESAERFRAVVELLHGARAHEHAGLPVLPAAYARTYLAMGLTERGEFEEALAMGREASGIAEATGHLDTIQWACYALGVALLDRGDAAMAIEPLERALSICRTADLPVYIPRTAAALGHAYALGGRAAALALLDRPAADSATMSHRNVHARILARLSEVYMFLGKPHEAAEHAARAVTAARERGLVGSEAHALRVLAMSAGARSDFEGARATYEAALRLATELGMRPVVALCQLDLGRLHGGAGRTAEAHGALPAALALFSELGMARWRREATEALASLSSTCPFPPRP